MALTAAEVISFRLQPDINAALAPGAEGERRVLASKLEVMVLG